MRLSKLILLTLSAVLVSAGCDKDGGKPEQPQTYGTLQAKSPKKGVAFNFSQLPEADIPLLGPACSWSYNWGVTLSSAAQKLFDEYSMDFCPMAWNTNWKEQTFRDFKAAHPECRYLLAYNEPNLKDQANMTPQEAAQDWGRLVAIAKELDLKLIAPAMNYGTLEGYSDPWKWYDEFFAIDGVSLDDVDGLAMHCYMESPASVKSYLDGFEKYGKPLWLTEFCSWPDRVISAKDQMKYMVETINMLEENKSVYRYAWFIPRGNGENRCHNNLLTPRKPYQLTDLGKVFVNMSTHDKTLFYKEGTVIPAEHYSSCGGSIHLAPVTDASGILELTDLKKETWAEWQVEVASEAVYTLSLRYTSYADTAMLVYVDGTEAATLQIPNAAHEWKDFGTQLPLTEGRHTIRIEGKTAYPLTLNYLSVK